MNKTLFSEKCVILGDLWLYYREESRRNVNWEYFFDYNDISLPSAYLLSNDLLIASGDKRIENFIDETWEMFCEFIEIDPEGWYRNLEEAFAASPRPPLENDDDEDDDDE